MSVVTATLAPSRELQTERLLVSRISSSIQLAEDDLDKRQVPHKVSCFTFVSLPVCILQFYIFYCPCWNRLAFYFVCMKQHPREADTHVFHPPRKSGELKALRIFWRVLLTHSMAFQGLRESLSLCYKIPCNLGADTATTACNSQTLFLAQRTWQELLIWENSLCHYFFFCNCNLKSKKGLNRRHPIILEMLYHDWRSEEMWMSLQCSRSCWREAGLFESDTKKQ